MKSHKKLSKNEKTELLKAVYEQHWLHARHVEDERLQFTNIFSIIIAATFGFLSIIIERYGIRSVHVTIPCVVVLFLSLCGYFMSMALRAPFVAHIYYARKVLEDYDELIEYWAYKDKEREKLYGELKRYKFHNIFVRLYIFFIFMSMIILLNMFFFHVFSFFKLSAETSIAIAAISSFCGALAAGIALEILRWKLEKKEEIFKTKLDILIRGEKP